MTDTTPIPELSDNLTLFKSIYSVGLLIFSIVIIMGLIFTSQTKVASEVSPILSFVAIWVGIIWLTMVEGGQGSLVGLAPINFDLYQNTHKMTYKITKVCYTGDNFDRYLLGRQFMVVLTVFVVNMSGGPIDGAELWGLPTWLTNMFLGSGLAMILFTCMVGQLNSQCNASLCMLDYINNYFALAVFWAAMAIEFSGVLHASYLFQMVICKLAGKPVESKEPPRNVFQSIFFWARCLMSVGLLIFAFIITLKALFEGKTTMWDGVPPYAAVVVFFILLSVVGMLEAMQIAFFAVAKLTKAERGDGIFAMKTCHLLFSGNGNNLPNFMIGRQLMVVSCMFFVARVTSVKIEPGEENIFGVAEWVQKIFNTGLLSALITTIVGSIAWQLVASAFPIAFLSTPITYIFLRICLLLEGTGICQGAWVIANLHKSLVGFKRDEVYIGTAEERAAKNYGDDNNVLQVGAGHIVKLPGFADRAPPALRELMEMDDSVLKFISTLHSVENGNVRKQHDSTTGSETSDRFDH